MKAQRRHELQTNSLAKALEQSGEFFRQHGTRVLLGVIFVSLIIILVVQRISLSRQRSDEVQTQLSRAWDNLAQLQQLGRLAIAPERSGEASTMRRNSITVVRESLEAIRSDTKDRAILAQAHVASGELNWQLANAPPLPGAATRPDLRLERDPEHYLELAEADYQTVARDFADQQPAAIAAHLGLAAIAENRENWSEAGKQYEWVINLPGAPDWAVSLARQQLANLERLQQPILIAPATAPTTEPAASPTTLEAFPTTLEASPATTQAATQPAR